MTWYLDALFGQRKGGVEVIDGAHKSLVPVNSTFPDESFTGDSCYVACARLSALKTGTISESRSRHQRGRDCRDR